MTKEEAIKQLKDDRVLCINSETEPFAIAYDMAIKALEQDCVSRADVFRIMGNLMSIPYDFDRPINKKDVSESMNEIRALPSVTPTRKKGKWIDTKEISMNSRGQIVHEVICSECNGISYFRGIDGKYIGANLCSNCGAEMESEE